MNSKLQNRTIKYALGAGFLLCAAGVTQVLASSSIVTFSVDMTGAANFTLGTDQVAARGTFNGYGTYNLTNDPASANPYLFSGTINDTNDANGGQLQYKFWNSDSAAANTGWENTANGQNRAALLPSTSGGTLVLPTAFFDDEGTQVSGYVMTFQVDMTQQININAFTPGTSTIEVRGNFEGWTAGLDYLTNDPTIMRTNGTLVTSNVYVGAFALNPASPGQTENFKFVENGNYEQPAAVNADGTGNRFAPFVNNYTNPIVYFSDAPPAPVVTVVATFSVDMSALIGGLFDPSQDYVDVRGTFNNWSQGVNICTNDPNAANTNIFSSVVTMTNGVGFTEQYKFTFYGTTVTGTDWENPAPPTVGGNRFFYLPNLSSTNLPVVYFSDVTPNSVLPEDTEVTFNIDMTGAKEYSSGTPFDPAADSVYLNADFLGWPAWTTLGLGAYQLTNNPVGSSNYSLTVPIQKGNPLSVTYKYGFFDGANQANLDDEAGFGVNHFRYLRQAPNYNMPTDIFGNQYNEPTAWGNLTVGSPTAGSVPVSWVGLPGVHLQTAAKLTGRSNWVDHLETDGTNWVSGSLTFSNGFVSVTNYPTSGGQTFFRLVKPAK